MIGRLFAAALFCVATFASAANAQNVSHRANVVVELYTSQGCIQCPRANRLVRSLSEVEGTLALTFPTAIWDYLGWQDTFATPEFTDRQRNYSRALRTRRSTPQLIFNGASQGSASNWDEARALVDDVRRDHPLTGGPSITIAPLRTNRVRVTIGAGARRAPASVWFVAYDPGPVSAFVTYGVNVNRRVAHYNLVSWIEEIGEWNGEALYFEQSRCRPQCAVLVQESSGGPIIAAAYTTRR